MSTDSRATSTEHSDMESTGDSDFIERELLSFREFCQNFIARISMQPADHVEYTELCRRVRRSLISYDEFHSAMSSLLRNPQYAHLRVHWDVFHENHLGEQELFRHPLLLFPVALCFVLNTIPCSAQPGDTLWQRALDHWVQSVISDSESRNIQNGGYNVSAGVTGIDNLARDRELDPDARRLLFLHWFQDQAARLTMRPEDYNLYEVLRIFNRIGLLRYGDFQEEIHKLLGFPEYKCLRVWWHVHEVAALGVTPMLENPYVEFPLVFCAYVNCMLYLVMFGEERWRSYLDQLRSRAQEDN